MTVKEALSIILANSHAPALNYAIAYAAEAMRMPANSEELRVQCLYVVSNISHWRHPQAKEVRATLKEASK